MALKKKIRSQFFATDGGEIPLTLLNQLNELVETSGYVKKRLFAAAVYAIIKADKSTRDKWVEAVGEEYVKPALDAAAKAERGEALGQDARSALTNLRASSGPTPAASEQRPPAHRKASHG